MDFINSLMISVQENSDLLGFIGVLLTTILSIYIFRVETSTPFIRERYDKLIFPLFDLIEPFLFQKCPEDTLEKALSIIEENKSLADGKLLEIFYYCKKNPSSNNFRNLCIYIDETYDRFCRSLGLKRRSMFYRLMRMQYRSKGHLFLYIFLYALLFSAIGVAIFLIFLFGVCLLYVLFMAGDLSDKMIILIFVFILSHAIIPIYIPKCVAIK